jgi:hypothetical protein
MADMEAIYAWTETDPTGGEGVIAMISKGGLNLLLQHRDKGFAMRFRAMAQRHAKVSGHKVRLVKFTRTETIEEIY